MNNNLNVVMIDTNKIKPYTRNARKNDETVMKLCEIIPKVGFNQPIVIDKNNVIVKGHSRWKAAVKLGMEKVPCIISQNDDETNKLDRLADNKIQEFSQWDDEILGTELASINVDDIELEDFGFDLSDFAVTPNFEVQQPVYDNSYENNYSNNNDEVPQRQYQGSYTPPDDNDDDFITEKDIIKTVATNQNDYGSVTCPKCGQVVLYKK